MAYFFTKNKYKNLWLNEFLELLSKNNYSNQQLSIIIKKIQSAYTLRNILDNENFLSEYNSSNLFFGYLQIQNEFLNFENINDIIDLAIKDMSGDIVSNIIKYIIKFNIEDVKTEINAVKYTDSSIVRIFSTLGGYQIASAILYIGNNNIQFDDIKVNKCVRRIGLGTKLFKTIFSYIKDEFPNYELVALNVDKNTISAIEFYKSLGAEIINSYLEDYYCVKFIVDSIEKNSERSKNK